MDFLETSSVFHVVAWIGTVAAFIFLILMFVGLDDVLDGWFIQRLAVAFACGFGWTGVILQGEGWAVSSTLVVSFIVGILLSGLLFAMILLLKKIAETPSESLESLVGKTAEVAASSHGDLELTVRVMFQGRIQEMKATKKGQESLPTGTGVRIDAVAGTGRLFVSVLG